MRRLSVILLVFVLWSCDFFNVKKTSSEAILNEELKTFNWNDVDEYPSFASCDSTFEKEQRKQCFAQTIAQTITEQLHAVNIVVSEHVNDTVTIRFQISEKGDLTILNIQANSLTYKQIPKIDSLLTNSLDALPRIYPAVKRGQQVTTEFDLPVVIQVN